MTISFFDELTQRGFISQISDPELPTRLNQPTTVYIGFDPTADSLHIGSLIPVMALAHFQRHGHQVLAVVGGATGMIGDPSGRSDERNLLTPEQVAINKAAMKAQLSQFIAFEGENAAVMLDNYDWIGSMSFVDWLREVGKHFTISYMLAKDSVKTRLASENGISFTEFSYMTLQAYDFLHLFNTHACHLQAGGNDQWGNITAGIELVRRVRGKQVYGMTFPLLSTSSGEKFGKSAGNAVWLDPQRTTPFQFFQYWMQTADADVERFLKLFTFLSLDAIQQATQAHALNPDARHGQRLLATEITRIVHGDAGLALALRGTEVLFGREIKEMNDADLAAIFLDVPSVELSRASLEAGLSIVDLWTEAKLAKSKGEARRLISGGGAYLNNVKIASPDLIVRPEHLVTATTLVLRSGKKNYCVVRFA